MDTIVSLINAHAPLAFGVFALTIVLIFGAITSRLRALLDDARAETAVLEAKLAAAYSPGHDLAQKIGWRTAKLMTKPEVALYRDLQELVARFGQGHRVFAQVDFGAFLEATARADLEESRKAAFHAVARKRADFLIIDRFGRPVAVAEYQGEGHYQGTAHDRDQAKCTACHAARLPFVEVAAGGLTEGQRHDLATRVSGAAKRAA